MKLVTCEICRKQFETQRPNKKYCSFSCKEAGRKLRRMVWDADHPGYSREYMKEYRAARLEEGKE